MPGIQTEIDSLKLAADVTNFNYIPETQEALEWAELPTIDLAKLDTPKGKAELAQQLIEAIRTKGFFYVKNFGISQEAVDRQFAIGQQFYALPLSEKEKYTRADLILGFDKTEKQTADLDSGSYNGYRPAGRRLLNEKTGLRDHVEVFNIPKFGGRHFDHSDNPELIKANLPEIEQFAADLHHKVLDPLHRLISIALELPENYFSDLHKFEEKSEDHLRYMRYTPYKEDEWEQLDHYAAGHTDLGTLTLLFRQPVAALQIKDHLTGEWRWAKPQNATLTVNTCDALSFLTGGYIKSTVTIPPKDQRQYDRLGLLYFQRPKNDLVLNTIKDSPVLQREGFTSNEFERSGNSVPDMEKWTYSKQKWQQAKGGYKDGATILPGFSGKMFA